MFESNESAPQPNGDFSSIALSMYSLALQDPDRPAFCKLSGDAAEGPKWFTWAQIAKWVGEACAAIELIDLPIGSHLATVEENSVKWFVLDFACQTLGYVHVAIDCRWPEVMIANLLEQSQAQLVFGLPATTSSRLQSLQNIRKLEWHVDWETPPISNVELSRLQQRASAITCNQPAQMLFTSGTSGEPKGVLLSHRNLVSNAMAKLDAAPQTGDDLRLNILPFCHAYARTCELSTWVLSKSRLAIATDWNDFLRQASELQPTLINLVPHLASKLLRDETTQQQLEPDQVTARLGGRVRLLQVGGAAMSHELWNRLEKVGLPPLQGYGLTETAPVICSNRAGQQRPGTIGPPVAGVDLRVDPAGQLWVRGEGIMLGYYDNPTATRERIQDGWLATGDLVEQDELGNYRIVGRLSEVIVLSTGHKVSPELIEGRLVQLEYIERVLLAGEAQAYVLALIWPAWPDLPASLFADESCDRKSLNFVAFQQMLQKMVRQALADLPSYAQPRKFIVMLDPLDSSLITPKGSLRRKLVLTQFSKAIDEALTSTSNIYSC